MVTLQEEESQIIQAIKEDDIHALQELISSGVNVAGIVDEVRSTCMYSYNYSTWSCVSSQENTWEHQCVIYVTSQVVNFSLS